MSQDHTVPVPGGSVYYRRQGHGPPLMLIGGGPSNADGRIVVAAGRESRGYYPYLCADRLAGALGLPLAELPGPSRGHDPVPGGVRG